MFDAYMGESIIKRAVAKRLISIKTHDLRKWASGKHRKVDDKPYGGGPGMMMMVEPFDRALRSLTNSSKSDAVAGPRLRSTSGLKAQSSSRIILMAASGKTFSHQDAVRLAKYQRIIFLCPRYEGIDARVEKLVDEKISIGNYVLTGGELPAMVIADAVARHIPGVLGKAESLREESHAWKGVTEYPQYTRPENYKGERVPRVLLSGDHKKISEWRKKRMKQSKKTP